MGDGGGGGAGDGNLGLGMGGADLGADSPVGITGGSLGASGGMAQGSFGGPATGVNGPDGGGPDDRNQFAPRRQQQRQRNSMPNFVINPNQVQQDIAGWGGSYQTPQANPVNYNSQPMANSSWQYNPLAPGNADWTGFFNLFGGK